MQAACAQRTVWTFYLRGKYGRTDSTGCIGLALARADLAAFGKFADAVVRSEHIAALLEHGKQ